MIFDKHGDFFEGHCSKFSLGKLAIHHCFKDVVF